MNTRHAGKIAVVTGAATGIGQAIVRRLTAEGARVAIADVAPCDATVALVRQGGGDAFARVCDITDPEHVRGFADEVRQRYGDPHVLVHSAAAQFMRTFDEITFEEWRRAQSVNHESVFHLLKVLLPGMRAHRWGRVVLIASSTFFTGTQAMAHYVTSKGALIGIVRGLASELGPHGITINALAPGLTRTDNAVKNLPDAFFQQIATLQAIPRSGTPEDQAGAVSFLVSEDAAFMTGQTMLVDGGQGRI
jgi:NAD(P)-dependent dehydrogenase (short-subunit alcohol dehydrogenase family)